MCFDTCSIVGSCDGTFLNSEGFLVKESEPRLLAEASVLGVVGALAAQCFTYALRISEHFFLNRIAGCQPPGLPEEGGVLQQVIGPRGLWLIPMVTTMGGLISGFLVYLPSVPTGWGTFW